MPIGCSNACWSHARRHGTFGVETLMALKVQTSGIETFGTSGVEMVRAPTFRVDFGVELLALKRQRREPKELQHGPGIASSGMAKVHTPVQGWIEGTVHMHYACAPGLDRTGNVRNTPRIATWNLEGCKDSC